MSQLLFLNAKIRAVQNAAFAIVASIFIYHHGFALIICGKNLAGTKSNTNTACLAPILVYNNLISNLGHLFSSHTQKMS